jgi:hypothetical protein
MSQAEKLSSLTFTILRAMRQEEEQRMGWPAAEPGVN